MKSPLTVQTHVVEGEDSGSTGGPRALEGHVQNAMWGLHTVLLEREGYWYHSFFKPQNAC